MVSWFLALVTVQAASVGFNIAVLLHAFAERAHLGALAGNACSTALKFNASDAYVLFVCFFVGATVYLNRCHVPCVGDDDLQQHWASLFM